MPTSTRRSSDEVDVALRRELVRSMAFPVGGLSAFGLAAALVPVRHHVARPAVLVPFAVLVLLTTALGGRAAGAYCAGVAGLAVDSFLHPPYPELELDRAGFWWSTLALVAVALVTHRLGRPRRDDG